MNKKVMASTELTIADFHPQELNNMKNGKFAVLRLVANRYEEKLASVQISDHGHSFSSSSNLPNPIPSPLHHGIADDSTIMIDQDSLNHWSAASTDPTEEDLMEVIAEALLQLSYAPPKDLITLIEQVSREKGIAPPKPELVIQKKLFKTDLDKRQARFSLPFSQIIFDFLTEGEKDFLSRRAEIINRKKNLDVKIMAPGIAPVTVKLSQWDIKKKNDQISSSYIIHGKWNAFVKNNNLNVKMTVQLWCFRLQEELCFALLPMDPEAAGVSAA